MKTFNINHCLLTLFISLCTLGASAQACQAGFTTANSQNVYTFQNTSTGSNLAYSWDFGDGATSNLENPTHTYPAAVNYCESFDDCIISSFFDRDQAFNSFGNGNPGCLAEWEAISGTPSVYRNSDNVYGGITAYDGTQFALIGVCDFPNASEDVALLQNFVSGTSYTVSMALRTGGSTQPLQVDFVLLDARVGTNPYASGIPSFGCSATNVIPSNGVVVHSLQGFSASSWQLITFDITNLTANYNRLWIRVSGNPSISSAVLLDGFCISSHPYTACLSISDTISGCSDTTCSILTDTVVTCNASFTYTNSGNDYAFQNTSTGNNLSYTWDFGDGATSNLQNPTHTYASPLNYCESFDNCIFTSAFTREHAFNAFGNGNPGCLTEWEVFSGTPSIYRNSDYVYGGVTAYEGTQFALIGVCDFPNASEDVALLQNFASGASYTVSMALRTGGSTLPINVDFVLLDARIGTNPYANGTPSFGCSATNAIPTSGVVVHSLQNFSASSWQVITFTISNLTSSYNRLWIRVSGNPAITSALLLDALCISSQHYTACLTVSDTASGCSDTTCSAITVPIGQDLVWPGDANADGAANVWDVLAIGVAYGVNGSTRPNATTNWIGQPAPDWQLQFLSGVNLKHADCDGNALIDSLDVPVIALNYGLTHLKGGSPERMANSDLYFEFPQDTFNTGDTVRGSIHLGTSANPVANVYGIAFSLLYNQNIIDSGSIVIDFTNSWMAPSPNGIALTKDLYLASRIDVGHSRIDHNNITGAGKIADVSFVIQDNIDGKDYLILPLELQFENVVAIDKDEIALNLSANGDTLYVKDEISSVGQINQLADVRIFPNPAANEIAIQAEFQVVEYRLLDLAGREILQSAVEPINAVSIDVSALESGVYIIHLKTPKNFPVCRRVMVLR